MAPTRNTRLPPNTTTRNNARLPKQPREQFRRRATDLIRKISDKDRYGIFLEPVDHTQVHGYAETITRPMDLSTLHDNLQAGVYRTPMELHADLDLIWSNCCTFNDDNSVFFKEAVRLRALAARYYDDLVRLLFRDGVASALGLAPAAPVMQNIPAPSRLPVSGRPPRPPPHLSSTAATAAAAAAAAAAAVKIPSSSASANGTPPAIESATPSPSTSSPSTPSATAPTHNPSIPSHPAVHKLPSSQTLFDTQPHIPAPSPSQMPATPHVTMRHSKLRRAQVNHAAALEAVRLAQNEVAQTARKAGLPPPPFPPSPSADGADATTKLKATQTFRGPGGILEDGRVTGGMLNQLALQYPIMNRSGLRGRCEKVSLEWERVGRWHGEEATHTPFLSAERAGDVHFGRKYARFVRSSAPIARRLLASVLDAETVHAHDMACVMEHARAAESVKDGGAGPGENGVLHRGGKEGECGGDGRVAGGPSKKRLRGRVGEGQSAMMSVADVMAGEPSDTGKLLVEVLGPERVRKLAKRGDQVASMVGTPPSKNAVSRMRSLLKAKDIDVSFVNGLMVDEALGNKERSNGGTANGGVKGGVGGSDGEEGRVRGDGLKALLRANYDGMVNTLRLRALRDSVHEAEREEVEDREVECCEVVAKGVALAAKQLPPRLLVHPMDAAQCARTMVEVLHPPGNTGGC